jgi:glyoxylase-like metal-dependent hydrolase (beta-lactamase superfamily II)
MPLPDSHELDHGITCIDADYIRPGLACFYLLQSGDQCAVIETGTSLSFPRLMAVLEHQGLSSEQVRYVIPTHVHLDHAGGAGTMMAAFPDAQLLIHPRGARHMIDPATLVASSMEVYGERRFRELYGDITPVEASRVVEMDEGDRVALGDRVLEFHHTRGHANHHFCIWDESSQGWFTGDMFGISYPWFRFPGGDYILPATTPTQFDPQSYLESLDILQDKKPRRMYLTHSGELEFSQDKVEQLRRQVLAYRDLAPHHARDKTALETALADYSLGMMVDCGPREDEAELREMLAFDIDLNSQGLMVWQQRTAMDG